MAPCSRCEQRGFTCLVAKDSSRCSRCINAGGSVKCDVHGPSEESWRSLERAEKKLDDEWIATQERLLALQSKLLRLDKQRQMFRKRAAEMLRRGLKSLDELDAAEEAERLAAERPPVVKDTPPLTEPYEPGSFGEMDPAVIEALSADFDPSDPFWATLDFDGGTRPVEQRSH